MITLSFIYVVAGMVFLIFAVLNALDVTNAKRSGNAGFWSLIAISFLLGDYLGDFANGILALLLVVIAGTGALGKGSKETSTERERQAAAVVFGNTTFLLALVVPATALIGTLVFGQFPALVDPKQVTLVSLAFGVLLAIVASLSIFKARPRVAFDEGRRLMDSVGWASVLPQMLASLGAVFAVAGMGDAVGTIIAHANPGNNLVGAVIAYGLGMALFTMVMGNAFAAFPVMFAALGMPVLITGFGGDPAIIASIGMLAGFCGTLMTPMAANYNIVPAALLELDSQYGVIRMQIATALPLLAINIIFIYVFAF